MSMIWELGPCSPKDVLEKYAEPKPHINTVATTFQILERKGYLSHKQKSRGYQYFPLVERSDYGKSTLGRIVSRLFGESYLNVVSTFVHDGKCSREELEEMLKQLKEDNN